VLRGTLYLYGKAWISVYCIGFIEYLVIMKVILPCSGSGWLQGEKSGAAVSKCLLYMGYHTNIRQCMQPNLFYRSGVPHAHVECASLMGHTRQKSSLLKLIVKFFLKGVVVMFWHDIVYIELLYCVTNFELVWTWNKVAVVENAKTCRLYPTLPYL